MLQDCLRHLLSIVVEQYDVVDKFTLTEVAKYRESRIKL